MMSIFTPQTLQKRLPLTSMSTTNRLLDLPSVGGWSALALGDRDLWPLSASALRGGGGIRADGDRGAAGQHQ